MLKTAMVIGTIIGAGYYLLLSAVWDTAIGQTQAYQKQTQQAVTMTEQIALGQQTSNH